MKRQIYRSVLLIALYSFVLILSITAQLQQRYALVIGNGNYTELGMLRNAKNDAEDVAASLRDLGFQVNLLLDASLVTMEDSIGQLADNLAVSPTSIGIFYYAGHGVQSDGVNYLIPTDSRISSESYLRSKSLSLQSVLENLRRVPDSLKIVILDACRDNPYQWGRSANRGLSVIQSQPVGSIIVYSTSAGSVALDGQGRNGVFTAELLKELKNPNLEIMDLFKKTGSAVQNASQGKQSPAIYSQYYGNIYLAAPSVSTPSRVVTSPPVVYKKFGSARVSTQSPGILYIDRQKIDALRAGGLLELSKLEAGTYTFEMQYETGERETQTIEIASDKLVSVTFSWKPEVTIIKPNTIESGNIQNLGEELVVTIPGSDLQTGMRVQIRMRLIKPGKFLMGSRIDDLDRNDNEGPVHEVEITKPFYMGIFEVTQAQYGAVLGSNPSQYKGMDLPVENIGFSEVTKFLKQINTLGIGTFRLPTEAEWEYACRAGTKTRFPWGDDFSYTKLDEYAWKPDAEWPKSDTIHLVGSKKPNPWGLYDMLGNVWELCADVYSEKYLPSSQINPIAKSGSGNVVRGGGSFKNHIFLRKTINEKVKYLRSASRDCFSSDYYFIGFRVVREED